VIDLLFSRFLDTEKSILGAEFVRQVVWNLLAIVLLAEHVAGNIDDSICAWNGIELSVTTSSSFKY
jgi:hypothetical protein